MNSNLQEEINFVIIHIVFFRRNYVIYGIQFFYIVIYSRDNENCVAVRQYMLSVQE
jgi:hypothetical protein